MRGRWRDIRSRPLRALSLGIAVGVLLLPGSASAHFAGFTGDTTYSCGTVSPYHHCFLFQGDGSYLRHSYGYQSAINLSETSRHVCVHIHRTDTDYAEGCYQDFVRKCWPAWYAASEGASQLNCHDRDGTSFWVDHRNASSVAARLRGHPHW